MKFFMTSEVNFDVDKDFQIIKSEVDEKMKLLEDRSYGDKVELLSLIPIIVDKDLLAEGFFKERVMYKKKDKETDIRLQIDHQMFKNADKELQRLLVINNIVNSVRALGLKLKSGFDATSLERDILDLFNVTKDDLDQL
ncbi:Imm44 family immunity protein [Paenibacillus faecalis]|uniref:Imm44 family immunity protein n=1 Tax=Paenibacillus faecalis TaxID=2079532 RepID=UPI000D0EFC8F|nr:Imm44 family immunity protein [Paenibacillus faecalis]